MKRTISILLLILFSAVYCFGQKETWNWVFGDGAGLSWKPEKLRSFAAKGIDGTPDAVLQNLPSSFSTSINNLEGVFSISDKEGNLLFYSNGIKIWNGEDKVIYRTLGGDDSSSQSGIVVPYPGDDKKYICIGLGEYFADNMGYVIVEANSPTDVTVKKERTEFSGHTGPLGESMSAIMHANGEDWWIVAPGKGQPICFNAWLATKAGIQISTPVKTPTTINYKDKTNGSCGYLKFTPDGKHFVWGTWSEKKLIYGDFDNNTGQFSNIRYQDNHGAYGVEFSPNQKYLYTALTEASYSGADFGVYIWDLEALLKGTTSTYLRKISKGLIRPQTLQLDVLGRIWLTDNYKGTRNMFLIDNPDNLNDLKIYKLVNFLARGSKAKMGLPSFSATFFKIFGDKGFCVNFPKEFGTFIPQVIGGSKVAYTRWNWGDGEPEDIVKGNGTQKVSHIYTHANDYIITVSAYGIDGKQLGTSQTMNIEVYPCILPVNPNVHLMK